jgi:IS30 family transposase
VHSLPKIGQVGQLCEACQVGKQRRRGNKYVLLLVDDLSRYMWVAMIPSKDRAAAGIKDIQARADGESGHKLKALCADRGCEFTATEFTNYYAAEGVHHQHTAP